MNGQERLGTFELERSNAMEQIVENVHGTVTFMLQIRKITVKISFLSLFFSLLFLSDCQIDLFNVAEFLITLKFLNTIDNSVLPIHVYRYRLWYVYSRESVFIRFCTVRF